jgi:hypothetical protein
MTFYANVRSALPRTVVLLAALLVAGGCGSTRGESVGASTDAVTTNHPRFAPSNVPSSYAATPYGFFHPSCMTRVEPGETALEDGTIRTAKGDVRTVPPCTETRFDPVGHAMPIGSARSTPSPASPASTTAYNGWIESYNTSSIGALSYLAATWIVPAPPAAPNDGQTIYFFNGLEGLPTVESILQPVLGFSGGHWTATSWNCCKSGTTYYGNTIDVNPGDVILGTINGTGCDASSGLCNSWSIQTLDQNTGEAAVLQTSAWGVAENWVFAGVLEVYGVASCDDLPASGQLAFANQAYTTVTGTSPAANWQLGLGTVSPACGYGGTIGGSSVTLDFTGAGSSGTTTAGNGLAVGGSYALHTVGNPSSCMDISGDGSANLTQVDEYACNGTPAQMFSVIDAGSGLVTLSHPHSGRCIDVAGAGTGDGTNVDLYDCNGTVAQQFSVQTDSSGNVTFVNPNSGKCLDVTGGSTANFTKIQLWDCNGGPNQKWEAASGGLVTGSSYAFQSLLGASSCLDVDGDGAANGTQVDEYSCNGSAAQTFTIVGAGGGAISLRNANGKCVDLYSSGTSDGTKVEVWDCNQTVAQQFVVESDANLGLTLMNPHSGKCLDIAGASTTNLTAVELWDCTGGNNQKWSPTAE